MSGYQTRVVSVGTTATLIAELGAVPVNDGILVNNAGTAAVYVGGAAVTTTTGFPIAAGATQVIPTTGAEGLALYGVVATGSANVAYIYPG